MVTLNSIAVYGEKCYYQKNKRGVDESVRRQVVDYLFKNETSGEIIKFDTQK